MFVGAVAVGLVLRWLRRVGREGVCGLKVWVRGPARRVERGVGVRVAVDAEGGGRRWRMWPRTAVVETRGMGDQL